MLRRRVIPFLLVSEGGLVKTRRFRNGVYLGDPLNTVRLFNDKDVPELIVLDIRATPQRRGPNLSLVRELAEECFMPLCFGGGVTSVGQIGAILEVGVEKVAVNTALYDDLDLLSRAAKLFGSQRLVAYSRRPDETMFSWSKLGMDDEITIGRWIGSQRRASRLVTREHVWTH